MQIVINYYKLGTTWYLDLPEHFDKKGSHEEDLERIGSFHDFLELAAEGKTYLSFELNESFSEGADLLELSGSAGPDSGVYYNLGSYKGKSIDIELWFNQVYHFVQAPPQKIYIKQLS